MAKTKKEEVIETATDGGPNPDFDPVAGLELSATRIGFTVPMRITLQHPDAVPPEYETSGAACFDLRAMVPQGEVTVDRNRPGIFDTGIIFEVPQDHVMLVFSRSGHGFNKDVRLANCVGIIDSDYRNTVKVKLRCDANNGMPLLVRHKDRIAQAMVIPVHQVSFEVAQALTETDRGEGGLGSTGNE